MHDRLERLGDDRRPVHVAVLRLVDLAHHRTGTRARGEVWEVGVADAQGGLG